MAEPELELEARRRLGLPLEGPLVPHQDMAVSLYVSRHAVTCSCGARALAADGGAGCPSCGRAVAMPASPAPPRIERLVPGARVGPLELIAVLGKGASGTVWKARHVELDRISALKVVALRGVDARVRGRFDREVEALAKLGGGGVVKIHAAFELEGHLAYEMELVEGETLAARLHCGGTLPWREAARIVAQLAATIARAHEAGVLHRDLKPANVLLRTEDGAALVADYGLARFVDLASSLTRPGTILGTPLYMAPEAFSGGGEAPVDVYGLGAILYECLTGRPPRAPATFQDLLAAVLTGRCEPTAAPGAPEALERLRARAMALEPGERPTAAELARGLEELLAGEEAPASSPRPSRLRAGVAGLLVALVLLAGVAWRLERGGARPDDGADGARADLERRRARVVESRRKKAPLDAEDLLELGRRAPQDLEELARHAIAHGLEGRDPIGVARELRSGRADSKWLAGLLAVVACAEGAGSVRSEVVAALRGAGVAPAPRVQSLGRALEVADALATALTEVGGSAADAVFASKAHQVAQLIRSLELPRAPAFVLASLEPPLRAAIRSESVVDGMHQERRRVLGELLDAFGAGLSPQLLVYAEVLRQANEWETDPRPLGDAAGLESAARAIQGDDPLMAAGVLSLVARRAVEETMPETAREIRPRLEAAERVLAAAAPAEGWERVYSLRVRWRCVSGYARLAERAAAAEADPTTRSRLTAEALGHWRACLETTRGEPRLNYNRWRDAARVIHSLLELGRLDEIEPLLGEQPPDGVAAALRGEVLRRKGDPTAARALVKGATPTVEGHAVLALAAADLGLLDEARDHLDRLRRRSPSIFEELREGVVAKRIEERASTR